MGYVPRTVRRSPVFLFGLFTLNACSADPATPPPARDAGNGDAASDVVANDAPQCVGSSEQPAPRADVAGAFDPMTGMIYMFGGDTGPTVNCIPQPSFSDETWAYDARCDRWSRVTAETHPSARSRSASAFDTRRRRLVMFGGRYRAGTSGNYTLLRDLWAFDVASGRWEDLTPASGPSPVARSNASLVYDAETDSVLLFGGNTSVSGLSFTPRNDTWAFDFGAGAWRAVTTTGAPTTRLFHAATIVGRSMVVFGGGGANAFMGPFYDDLWRLDLATGAWSEVTLRGDVSALAGRISSGLVAAPSGDAVVVVGGHDDGSLGNRNDVISIALDGMVSVRREGDVLNRAGSGFCDFPADFTATDQDSPERRSAFLMGVDAARNRVLVYGGKTDCGTAGDVWSLDLMSHTWRSLRGTTDGLSCQRSGRENCRSLCQ